MDLTIVVLVLIGVFHTAESADCGCATDVLNVRSGAGTSHSVIGSLTAGQCAPIAGASVTAEGYTWAHVTLNGQQGWAATNWLHIGPCTGGGGTATGAHGAHSDIQKPGCPPIISRNDWGARPAARHIGLMPGLPKYIFIHHGATPACSTRAACQAVVKSYQNYHIDTHGWEDIGYNFVVGEDGNAYEGRGWHEIGAHTLNYNSVGIAICIAGDFTSRLPNAAALDTVRKLIQCASDNHMLIPTYHLCGHRDVNPGHTSCPGKTLGDYIHSWPHYGSCP